MKLSRRTLASVFLLINTVCWGAAAAVVKPSLSFISPTEFLFLRFLCAALLTLPLLGYYVWKQPALFKNIPTLFWLESIGTTLTLMLFYEGLSRTSSLEANVIATAAPLFVVVGGVLFLREREERHEIIGLLVALAGTLLMAFTSSGSTGVLGASVIGNILVLTGNTTESGYFLLAKKKYAKLPKFFVTTISFWVGALSFWLIAAWQQELTPLHLLEQARLHLAIPQVALAVGYMAIFGSIIGLTVYILGQNMIEASEASLYRYLQPLVYIPIAIVFLHEPITPIMTLSLLLIGIGVFLAEYKHLKKQKPRRGSRRRRG